MQQTHSKTVQSVTRSFVHKNWIKLHQVTVVNHFLYFQHLLNEYKLIVSLCSADSTH